MNSISEIKNEAKKIYTSDMGRFAGVEVISFLAKFAVIFAIITISIICLTKFGSMAVSPPVTLLFIGAYLLYYFLIAAPINLGKNLFYTRVVKGSGSEIDTIFHFYSRLKLAIYVYFRIAIAVIFYTVVFTAITIAYFRIYSLFSPVWFSLLNFMVCAAIIVIYLTMIVITKLKYSLVPVVYNKENGLHSVTLVCKSLRYSAGSKSGLFLLHLSFIGWYLLGVLSLGIGFIWIMPYIRIATKVYLTEIVK